MKAKHKKRGPGGLVARPPSKNSRYQVSVRLPPGVAQAVYLSAAQNQVSMSEQIATAVAFYVEHNPPVESE